MKGRRPGYGRPEGGRPSQRSRPDAGSGTPSLFARAPAKVNLCLFVGPTRADGRHELVTVMESLGLADELRLDAAGGSADEVVCPGVEGPNLAAAALAAFRTETGWDGAPVRLTIAKRIPVAGGMAGGSADAAAALRLAAAAAGVADAALLERIGAGLGADVPSQVRGGRVLATGAGEVLRALPPAAAPLPVLVLPVAAELTAGAVYAEADRLGLTRDARALATSLARVEEALAPPGLAPVTAPGEASPPDALTAPGEASPPDALTAPGEASPPDALTAPGEASPPDALLAAGLVHNDLQDAARSLCPPIDDALDALRDAGADHALVSGSGPTCVGLFADPVRARAAADRLAARRPAPILTAAVSAGAGAPRPVP